MLVEKVGQISSFRYYIGRKQKDTLDFYHPLLEELTCDKGVLQETVQPWPVGGRRTGCGSVRWRVSFGCRCRDKTKAVAGSLMKFLDRRVSGVEEHTQTPDVQPSVITHKPKACSSGGTAPLSSSS